MDRYLINNTVYAIFDQSGSLRCYQKATVKFAKTIYCNGNDYSIDEMILFEKSNVNFENCLDLNLAIVSGYPSNMTYSRPFRVKGQNDSITICYELILIPDFPSKQLCNTDLRDLKINPKYFVSIQGSNLVYIPPTVGQYEFLERIQHNSINRGSNYDLSGDFIAGLY